MLNLLPIIHINVKNSPAVFINEMAKIAVQSGEFNVEATQNLQEFDGFSITNFRVLNSKNHHGLGVQLITQSDKNYRVIVELRAIQWNPETHLSYEVYVNEAKYLVAPLLSAYNKKFGTRYRISIPSKEKLEPKLPEQSHKMFKCFTNLANKSCLHPLDWRRFYNFVHKSRMRSPLTEEDMAYLLFNEGFSKQYAQEIANIYVHLVQFKRLT